MGDLVVFPRGKKKRLGRLFMGVYAADDGRKAGLA